MAKKHDRLTFERRSLLRRYLERVYRTHAQIERHLLGHGFTASSRTIARDIAALREEFHDVWEEQVSAIGTQKMFRIKRREKTRAEALAPFIIRRAIRQLRQLDDAAAQDAVVLLSDAHPASTEAGVFTPSELPYITIGEYTGVGLDVSILHALVDAIQGQHVIQFKYRGRGRSSKLPQRMLEYHGVVYVIVWSAVHKRYEPYRVDGITDIVRRREKIYHTFNFRDFMHTRFGLWEGAHAEVIIEISDPLTAANFRERRWHNTQEITDLPEGGIRITMQCGMSPELVSLILHWTPKITVVSPPELKEMVRAKLQEGLDTL